MKTVTFSKQSVRFLRKVNTSLKKRFQNKIDMLMQGTIHGNRLSPPLDFYKRVRVGDYRILYIENTGTIHIEYINHRSKIYTISS